MASAVSKIIATFFLSDSSKNYAITLKYPKDDSSYFKLSWLTNVMFDLQKEKISLCSSYSGIDNYPMPAKCVKILKQVDFSKLSGREKSDLWDLFPRFVYPLMNDMPD